MINHLEQLGKSRLLVVGDVMLDRYWFGETERISPEAPVPIVHVGQSQERPGGAGNVAYNLHALGATVRLIGQIGQDYEGERLKCCFENTGIILNLIIREEMPTVTKLRVLSRHQQLIRLDFEDQKHALDPVLLKEACQAHLSEVDVLLLSDYAKGMLCNPQLLIDEAKFLGIPIVVDPKAQDFSCYRGATVLTPNRKELERVVGVCRNIEELVHKSLRLIKEFSFGSLLVTLGAEGMCLVKSDGTHLLIPAKSREVFDVTGAGDTVVAVLGCALGQGIPIEEAVYLSNLAAGLVVQKLGASTVTLEELKQATQLRVESTKKVLSVQELQNQVKLARARGEKVILTNGCFDILHAGHVIYLAEARQLGDKLIVALNDDDSVKRLKGPKRPLHSLRQRQLVLSALTFVDWVVSFSEDTPEALIDTIKPDVLVKGGDYQPDAVVGAQIVHQYGGQVKVLTYEPKVSTSRVLDILTEENSF